MRILSHGDARGATGDLPVLGLLVTEAPPELRALLLAMRHRCRPRYAGGGGTAAARAYLLHNPADPPPAGAPLAMWLPADAEPDPDLAAVARVLLTADLPTAMAWDDAHPVEAVPGASVAADPVPPFVRRRLRTARHLDPDAVAAYEDGTWWWGAAPAEAVRADLADTLCAVAAAVVATTPALAVRALAWGAPLVTDPATATAIGAEAGEHCVVATDRGARARAARELAADHRLAARIGWRGRLHFERWHDLGRVADRVADRLDLPPARGAGPVDGVLASLGTPAIAGVRDRAQRATATLTPHGEGALLR